MTDAPVAKILHVHGIVQGVGFRPFVYQLAHRLGINGHVGNTSSGVTIHLEGHPGAIAAFIRDLETTPPPLARITDIHATPGPWSGLTTFFITPSIDEARRATLISPDVCICDNCHRELFDPKDRRYRYPFINCTNCGPRYTIIKDVPYDRPKTAMARFSMCPRCQAEYDDPMDRRFHAQPNACPVCGPQITLTDVTGRVLAAPDAAIAEAARRIKAGNILAVKGLGGFHLAVDAENTDAVERLRVRKHREEKPFALMAPDLDRVHGFAVVDNPSRILLESPERPIVILEKRTPNPIAESVAPRNRYFGVMLPYTPLHCLLLAEGFTALVMTSANLSEEPICVDNPEAYVRLSGIADAFLVHDRDICLRSDDSIVRVADGGSRLIRRSRGYVPVPVFLRTRQSPVLACGAMLKNTVCLTRGDQAFLSQHVGDLENAETLSFFESTIAHLERILDIVPEIVAHDLHPDYLSTRYALARNNVETVGIQHHHAHIVSAMAENQLEGPVIGLAFDGTGYGTDGKIWGGEVLIAEPHDFTRHAHLDYVPMPGGEAAIREPWRMAVSYLHHAFGKKMADLSLPSFAALDPGHRRLIVDMIEKSVNAPETSSMGRLFDGVAAIIGLRHRVRHEGQAAMELEMAAGEAEAGYDFSWDDAVRPIRISPDPIIRAVVSDVLAGCSPASISGRFHATLVALFCALCARIRSDTGLSRVILSGGVFQNVRLLTGLSKRLRTEGFAVFTHRQVPTNDGGLSLGQAVAASEKIRIGSATETPPGEPRNLNPKDSNP